MWPNQIEVDSLQTHLCDTHQTGCFNAFTAKSAGVARSEQYKSDLSKLVFSWKICFFFVFLL